MSYQIIYHTLEAEGSEQIRHPISKECICAICFLPEKVSPKPYGNAAAESPHPPYGDCHLSLFLPAWGYRNAVRWNALLPYLFGVAAIERRWRRHIIRGSVLPKIQPQSGGSSGTSVGDEASFGGSFVTGGLLLFIAMGLCCRV